MHVDTVIYNIQLRTTGHPATAAGSKLILPTSQHQPVTLFDAHLYTQKELLQSGKQRQGPAPSDV